MFLKNKFMEDYKEAVEEFGNLMPLKLHFNEILQVLEDNHITNSTPMVMKDWLFYLKISLADCLLIADMERKLKTQNKKIPMIAHQAKNLCFLKKTGKKLLRIRTKMQDGIASSSHETQQRRYPGQLPLLDPTKIYGVDHKVKHILHKLFLLQQHDDGEDATINTIGIVGMGGSGKSALAEMVFQSPRVQENYSHMVWIEFSNDAKLKHIYLEENTGRDAEYSRYTPDLDDLLQKVYYDSVGQKYLIVLDNVTDKCLWYYNQSQRFPRGNGGAIIVTTRSEDFAMKMVGGHGPNLYRVLPDLDGESCWSIFQDSMCMDLHFKHKEMLLKMKDEIVEQCGGLPMAAKTLAQIIPLQIHRRIST